MPPFTSRKSVDSGDVRLPPISEKTSPATSPARSSEASPDRTSLCTPPPSSKFKRAALTIWAAVADARAREANAEPYLEELQDDCDSISTRISENSGETHVKDTDNVFLPDAETLRQTKIRSAARVLRSVNRGKGSSTSSSASNKSDPSGADGNDRREDGTRVRTDIKTRAPRRRSFMRTTPWKTRLPPLPSVVGMHVFRRLYMARLMSLQVLPVKADDALGTGDSDDETDDSTDMHLLQQEPEVPRICADLSPEGQYAMLRGYQDRLLERLERRVPDLPSKVRTAQTPMAALSPMHDNRKWRDRRTECSIQDAMDIIDDLEEEGSSHLSDLRKRVIQSRDNPLRSYRKWCKRWQDEFQTKMDGI